MSQKYPSYDQGKELVRLEVVEPGQAMPVPGGQARMRRKTVVDRLGVVVECGDDESESEVEEYRI